jgi:hypothetical protein
MRRFIEAIVDLRPAWIGTSTTVVLNRINTWIGILVGLATLIYLILRIRKKPKR